MVVAACGAFLGAKGDPSVRIIHLYKQTKGRIQLQAMLRPFIQETTAQQAGCRRRQVAAPDPSR